MTDRTAPVTSERGHAVRVEEEYRVGVLVIGAGAAGLRAAIAAKESNCDVLVLSKSTAGLGTATVISYGAFSSGGFGPTTIEDHFERTIETCHFTNDPALVRVLSEEAPVRIRELRSKGMKVKETRHGVVAEGRFPIFGRQIVRRSQHGQRK